MPRRAQSSSQHRGARTGKQAAQNPNIFCGSFGSHVLCWFTLSVPQHDGQVQETRLHQHGCGLQQAAALERYGEELSPASNVRVEERHGRRWADVHTLLLRQVGAFVLNFNGRVTMASVKNFQLITHDDQDAVILQVLFASWLISLCTHLERRTTKPPPLLHSLAGWARTSSPWISSGQSHPFRLLPLPCPRSTPRSPATKLLLPPHQGIIAVCRKGHVLLRLSPNHCQVVQLVPGQRRTIIKTEKEWAWEDQGGGGSKREKRKTGELRENFNPKSRKRAKRTRRGGGKFPRF